MVFWYTTERIQQIMVRVNEIVTILAIDLDYFFMNKFSIREKKNIKLRV